MKHRAKEELSDTPFISSGNKINERKNKQTNKDSVKLQISSTPYDTRDDYYTAILEEYKDEFNSHRKQIHIMRNALFWAMFVILLVISITCCIGMIIVLANYKNSTSDIITIITLGISFISTLIAIPLAITKSLFPEKENDQIVGVLTKLIENDINIRTQTSEDTKMLKEITDWLKNKDIDKNKKE